ncbi:hypothetical protein NDU88_000462 [Pleurodeles waltl]|uniref:Uncharacterized protein n=1 Tax=Pleurodeles waltl TaxID=8319 RepID=A0AAV7KNF5_PLEWA|nr:hypothetical protein NDU88_000462 [Pleurodeles waltl]
MRFIVYGWSGQVKPRLLMPVHGSSPQSTSPLLPSTNLSLTPDLSGERVLPLPGGLDSRVAVQTGSLPGTESKPLTARARASFPSVTSTDTKRGQSPRPLQPRPINRDIEP